MRGSVVDPPGFRVQRGVQKRVFQRGSVPYLSDDHKYIYIYMPKTLIFGKAPGSRVEPVCGALGLGCLHERPVYA